MKDPRVVAFRMPFWRWYLAALVAAQVLCLALSSLVAWSKRGNLTETHFWASTAIEMAAAAVLLVPGVWLYVLVWRVRIDPDRLCGSDVWGYFVTVRWGSIHAAKPFTLAGVLPYLRVYSGKNRPVIWLPLFLADYRRFAELVAEYAGEDHPITREVWRRIEDS